MKVNDRKSAHARLYVYVARLTWVVQEVQVEDSSTSAKGEIMFVQGGE